MNIKPDFYFVSTEYVPHIGPLECYVENVLKIGEISYLNITLIPGLYGGNKKINSVVLGPRYVGDTLVDTERWPVYVNVFLSDRNNHENNNIRTLSDLKIIAWAEIHKTKDDSLKALKQF